MELLSFRAGSRRPFFLGPVALWLGGLFFACGLSAASASNEQLPRAYEVKAVYLFNFARFVAWPVSTFTRPDAPLVIGILGPDPFGPFLDEVVRSERVDGHPIVVRRFQTTADIDTCHILYVSHTDPLALAHALDSLHGRGVLTVGDAELFTQRGGMIRFVTENNRVRLRINLSAARAAGLVISSQLLRPAEIVINPRTRLIARR